MKKLKTFLLVIFSITISNAQHAEWIRQISSTGPDSGEDITIDDEGNVYVTGNYSDGANFGNGVILQSAGQQDVYAAKYSSFGDLLWLFSSGSSSVDGISGIHVDDQGFTYITGYTSDNEGINFTIIKIDIQGNFVWEVTELIEGFGGGNNIAVDDFGNVYVSGNFSETIYFNDGASSTTTLTTPDNRSDIFLAKYNSAGEFQWVEQEGGIGDDFGIGIAVTSSGTIFMSGWFENSAYGFSAQGDDAFVASYSSSGNLNWVKQYGGANHQEAVDIALGNDNSIFVVGADGPINGNFDGFVSKYNQSTGQLQWTDIILGVELKSIFVYADNSYFVGGLTDNGAPSDFFLAKYISNNQEEWQYIFGGDNENGIEGIAGDNNGNAYVTGWFHGSFTEGGTTYNSSGSSDGIVAQIVSSDYCLSTSLSSNYGYISNVELNTSANSSSTCDSYTNNDMTIAEIYPGLTTVFEVTLSSCGGNFAKGIKIFIDWNQDNDFVDSGEDVYVSGIVANGIVSGSFLAPNNFSTGGSTVMRIVCMNMINGDPTQDDPADITPCGEYSFGETEDYEVNLIDYMPPNITGFSPSQGYIGDQVTIEGNFFDPATIDSVQFNTINASYAVVNNNTILASPNIGSTTGLISIYYENGSVISSAQSYELLCTEEFTGFEDQMLPNGWLLFNQDQSTTFQIIDLGAYGNSSYSAYIPNFNYNAPGQLDGFLLGNICVEGAQTLTLEFDLAYTYYLENNIIGTDTLLIINLDNNEIIWKSGGEELATADPQGTSFIPTASEWDSKIVDLTGILQPSTTVVNIAILNFNGFGNNLYLDNISVVLDGALPVEFTGFWGEARNEISHLTWKTASEHSIKYFRLERSEDGVIFKDIAQVEGKGNSDQEQHYFYADNTPISGDNYYRVVAVEYDGSEIKSQSIVLSHTIISSPINISPNPTLGMFEINNKANQTLEISITNSVRQIIHKRVLSRNTKQEIDLSNFPSGVYFIYFMYGNKFYSEKIIKF